MASTSQKSDKFINLVLLGETGVGKSTFINSIVNYLTFPSFKEAERNDSIVLIPSKCLMTDKEGKHHILQIGNPEDDSNECFDEGKSATQNVRSYVFPVRNDSLYIRLIDTPGIGDGRGIDQDNQNCEKILDYIGKLEEIHAICYLFKPTNPRLTVSFQYCMTQILSRLDKSASKNLIFIFTNTGGTNYGPGDTFIPLRKVIGDIKSRPPYADIPLDKNVFCLDNEAFRYLAAVKQNIKFDLDLKRRNQLSWRRSSERCNGILQYLIGDSTNPPLEPHLVQSTRAVNEARRLIVQLSQPLAEIFQLISDNLFALERHKEYLNMHSDSLQELKKNMYMPIVDLEVESLAAPVTICANKKCAEIYKVGDVNKWHYKQRCHDPCYLKNVPKEIIGSPALLDCESIHWNSGRCIECDCDFSSHMHVYYMTKTVERRVVDDNVKENIVDKEELLEEVTNLVVEISTKKEELEKEHKTIVQTCAKFAHFLQNHAITPFCDCYKDYIEYLIIREQSLGNQSNKSVVSHLQKLLKAYEQSKNFFDEASTLGGNSQESHKTITPQKIQESIQNLYKLKHSGGKIKELFDCQEHSRNVEYTYTEYVHHFQPGTVTNKKELSKKLGTRIKNNDASQAGLNKLRNDTQNSKKLSILTKGQTRPSPHPGNRN